MKDSLLFVSRNLFKSVALFDSLLTQAVTAIVELREIKELLRLQNERGKDTQLLTAEETAVKLKVTTKALDLWKRTGVLLPIRVGGRNYYRLSDIIQRAIIERDLR